MKQTGNLLTLVPSLLLFLLSLIFPAFTYAGPSNFDGWMALVIGGLPTIFGILSLIKGNFDYFGTVAWLANPVLLMSWVFILNRSRAPAMLASLAALALSLLFLTTHKIPMPDGGTRNVSMTLLHLAS